jgi:hypothetical protein
VPCVDYVVFCFVVFVVLFWVGSCHSRHERGRRGRGEGAIKILSR